MKKGSHMPIETKLKLSLANHGRHHTKETLERISATKRKNLRTRDTCIDTNNPKPNDLIHGCFIGKKDNALYAWTICKKCNEGRWLSLDTSKKYPYCKNCYTNPRKWEYPLPKGTIENPLENDIRKATEFQIKKYKNTLYIWKSCPDCGIGRWIQVCKASLNRTNALCVTCSQHPRIRFIDKAGYVNVRISRKDKFYCMAAKSGTILEHRLIMARHLDRLLTSKEIVHHKNGIKTDNRIDNLEITCGLGQHSKNHSKGYSDGFSKGFIDGTNAQIIALKLEIKELKCQIIKQSNGICQVVELV